MRRTAKRLLKPVFRFERGLYIRGLLPSGNLTLPNFLGLGPGQSASTWLAEMLRAHPNVFVAKVKETHYFDQHIDDMPLHHYASHFSGGRGRICGEITPGYSNLRPDRIELVARLMPDVRLILVIRNPIDRSWSAARRVMPKLGTTLDEIADDQLFEYLRQEWSYSPPGGVKMKGAYAPGLLEGHYTRAIDNWLSYFPDKQLLVLFFDDICDHPAEVLVRVCEHIGAEPTTRHWDDATLKKAVNQNPAYRMPDHVYQFLKKQYRSEIERLAERFGGPAKSWLSALG